MTHTATQHPSRFAATATPETDDDVIDVQEGDDQMHELFEQWLAWRRTKRFALTTPAGMGNILGKLRGPSRPSRPAPDAACDPFMFALNTAIGIQSDDALDKRAFWLHHVIRVRPVKTSADALGISRQHFYRLLSSFGQRVLIAAKQIEADNVAAGEALPHRAVNVE